MRRPSWMMAGHQKEHTVTRIYRLQPVLACIGWLPEVDDDSVA